MGLNIFKKHLLPEENNDGKLFELYWHLQSDFNKLKSEHEITKKTAENALASAQLSIKVIKQLLKRLGYEFINGNLFPAKKKK